MIVDILPQPAEHNIYVLKHANEQDMCCSHLRFPRQVIYQSVSLCACISLSLLPSIPIPFYLYWYNLVIPIIFSFVIISTDYHGNVHLRYAEYILVCFI